MKRSLPVHAINDEAVVEALAKAYVELLRDVEELEAAMREMDPMRRSLSDRANQEYGKIRKLMSNWAFYNILFTKKSPASSQSCKPFITLYNPNIYSPETILLHCVKK